MESGEIVTWRWEGAEYFPHFEPGPEPPPWWDPYHCSFFSEEQNPTAWFEDECFFELTLTVWDASGNSDSITRPFLVLNVPPVADFSWHFEQPPDLLPSCAEIGAGNLACQEPEIPPDAGVIAFEDLSYDSGQWSRVVEWEWISNPLLSCWEPEEGCLSVGEPKLIGLSVPDPGWPGPRHPRYLLAGDFEVQLSVWDDDDAGGEDYPSSNTTQTVTIANIPPYAAFEWEDLGSSSEAAYPFSCYEVVHLEAVKPGGPPSRYWIHRVNGAPDCGANIAPWVDGLVRIEVESVFGQLEITETLPEGWEYSGVQGDCLNVDEQGPNYWRGTIDLASCSGESSISYGLHPPYEGPLGTYRINTTYVFSSEGTGQFVLERSYSVTLSAMVNVTQWMDFHGLGAWHGSADPNGDEVTWDWEFSVPTYGGPVPIEPIEPPPPPVSGYTDHGQDPTGDYCQSGSCSFQFSGVDTGALSCTMDSASGWYWTAELPVTLTVTDELGASTTVEATIPLSGPCD
ncbi:MAG: hypothetical protein NUW06_06685 [Candidatus Acetothermia bacterium]|nr:hypothetical protein [Candidatus Acetothermia bacterium]MDH7505434.1 hypothetical protein [Candidatus Acetothermia bacterium]